jgi:serine protease Do
MLARAPLVAVTSVIRLSSIIRHRREMRSRTAQICVLLAAIAGGLDAHATENLTDQELVARELPAVVSISIVRAPSAMAVAPATGTAERSAEPVVPRGRRFLGSGFVIDSAGIIVTNRHVIEGATDILVRLQDNTLLHGILLAKAEQIDVALIKVSADSPLASVHFGDSDTVRVADQVIAIGNPLGLGGTVTRGIVSALNRDIRDTPFDDYIQTDAAINHGNSGGPLFNARGEVIGMNTAIVSPEATSGSIGLGFAIPSNDVKYIADALRSPDGIRLGTLDFRIQQVTPEIADALNMSKAEGVIVGGMTDGGAASKCGIMAGDIILRYGNLPVKDVRALARAISRTPPGTAISLRIWRNDEPIVVTATVREIPRANEAASAPTPTAFGPGWRLARIDDASRHTFGLESDLTGAVVLQIAADGAAAEAGLNAGDVIVQVQQEKVTGPEDVDRLLAFAREHQHRYVAVLVHRNSEGLRWLAVSLA